MAKSICLTENEASVLIDVLYDFRGQYSIQSSLNDIDSNFDDSVFQAIIAKIQESEECMTINCEDVAGCIDAPNVVNQIRNQLRIITVTDETVVNNIVGAVGRTINNTNSYYEVTNIAVLPTVNPNDIDYEGQLWAGISALVDYCNRANLDFLQSIEALTNSIELSGLIAEATPAVGDQLGAIINMADKLIEFATENYIAYETEEILTALKCRLYCQFKNQSSVALLDIVSAILIQGAESSVNIDIDGFQNIESIAGIFDVIGDLATIDDEVTFWALWILQFAFYTFQNVFFGVSSWDSLFRRFEIARLIPNNGYLACTLCEDGAWSHTFDFTQNNGVWVVSAVGFGGVYVAGQYWNSQDALISNGRRRVVRIMRSFTPTTITGFTVNFNWTKGNGASNVNGLRFFLNNGSGGAVYTRNFAQLGANESSYSVDGLSVMTGAVLLDHTASLVAPPTAWTGISRVISVTLRGTGLNPFIGV